jgi:type I restriction enzyme, S subunit
MTDLPDGWSSCVFADVARYAIGRTPARASAVYWQDDGANVPWVAISDMRPHGVVRQTRETISGRAFRDVFGGRIVPASTLLMSFKLTIGRVAMLGIPACHNEAIISIFPNEGVNKRFLGYYLSSLNYADHHDRQIKGNTLNKAKLDRLPIVLPPEPEQEAIANALDLIIRANEVGMKLVSLTESLRSSAVDELMSGRLRTTELDLTALKRLGSLGDGA